MKPDVDIKEARFKPGPGNYNLAQLSDFGVMPETNPLQIRRTENPLQMPLHVSELEPQQTMRKLEMSKSPIRLARMTMKEMRNQERIKAKQKEYVKWPRSTFGAGRTPIDGWGRGTDAKIPGPGTYDAAPEGTFDARRKTTEDMTVFAETAHLKATERRLEDLRKLQVKHRKGILDIAEKGMYEHESRPSTVERLQRRKEHFEGLLATKTKTFDEMMRPRSSYVLPCQAISSRRSRRAQLKGRASPSTLQVPSFELPPRPKTMQTSSSAFTQMQEESYPSLLSNYNFATATAPASEAYGFGLLDCEDSRSITMVSGRDIVSREKDYASPIPPMDMSLARLPRSRNQDDDRIPSDRDLDSDGDESYRAKGLSSPMPAVRSIRPRSVPMPSFWPIHQALSP